MIELPPIPSGYQFHHLGYATKSINSERSLFEFLGYRLEGDVFTDQQQGVMGCFLVGAGPRIELLENIVGSDTLTPLLSAGIKIYHLAYLVDDVQDAIEWARRQRAKVLVAPVPAQAFGGRPICFVMFRNGLLFEFIENGLLPK